MGTHFRSANKRIEVFLLAVIISVGQFTFSAASMHSSASLASTLPAIESGAAQSGQKDAKLPQELIPLGHAIGIKIVTDGVIVVGMAPIKTETGEVSPASDGGIQNGDIIMSINGKDVDSTKKLQEMVGKSDGNELDIALRRKGKDLSVRVTPANAGQEGFRLGVWARDSIAGIGTLTFYDPSTKIFGALGHGINDIDTGELVPLSSGAIMLSSITGIRKGEAGKPGELKGDFDMEREIGALYSNSMTGVFGKAPDKKTFGSGKAFPVARKSEIKTGPATIFSSVEGSEICEYGIEILKVYPDIASSDRDMMIRVTDETLLSKTGGIVQGMSGSPIIQNGKIIGAVTHVLVNDPKRGYGISVEKMLIDAHSEQ